MSRLAGLFDGLRGWSEVLRLRSWTLPVTPTLTAVALVIGVGGAVAAWIGAAASGGGWVGLAFAFVAVPVLAGLALVGLLRIGLRAFGVVHLGYLVVVLAVPLVGVAVVGLVAAGTLGGAWVLCGLVLLVPAPTGWYATHVEPFRLVVATVPVPVDPARRGSGTVRIGVLADLQTNAVGPYEQEVVTRLLAEAPDLILVPGDLFQATHDRFAREESRLRALLARLEAPHGVYFVRGDAEHWGDAARCDYAGRALRGTGIVVLDDEIVDLGVGDRRIRLGGNRLDFRSPPAQHVRRTLETPGPSVADEDDGTIRLLVAHRPDAVLDLAPDSRVDLTVAGHTHGGQIVLPGFGPLLTLTSVPRRVARGGLHSIAGNRIYVSPGVGLERAQAPQVRLLCRPTIAILELR